ncbi:MAG: ABC transporter ATP-binding protein, partial [Spirochaetaceae bacterium]|nr:ABC transporter ATP-binding protein [Spirochaetaceae bacterium]
RHQIELLEYLSGWVKANNKIVIGVLHDLNLAYSFFENALLVIDGAVYEAGRAEALFSSEKLQHIYGIDVRGFMLRSLGKWQE